MSNSWRILGLLGSVYAAAVATGFPLLFNVVYLLVGLLVLSWLWSRASLRWLDVALDAPGERFQVGDELVERVALRNRSFLPKLWVAVLDETTLPGHPAGRVADLP